MSSTGFAQYTSPSLVEVHTFVGRTLDLNSDLMLKDLFRSVTPKEFLSMSKREKVVFRTTLRKKKKNGPRLLGKFSAITLPARYVQASQQSWSIMLQHWERRRPLCGQSQICLGCLR